jgi:hypothetical protein
MMISLTRAKLLTTPAALTAAVVVVSFVRGVPAAVHYISHDKVTEVMSKGGRSRLGCFGAMAASGRSRIP